MEKIKYELLAKKANGMLSILVKCTQYQRSLLIDTNIRVFNDEWDDENKLIVNNPNAKKLNLSLRKTIYELEEYEFGYDGDINIHNLKKTSRIGISGNLQD